MKKEDLKDYLALLTILSFSLAVFVYFSYDRQLQSAIMVVTALLYVLWGIIHHLSRGSFHFKVLAEYVTIALFASALMLTLLNRT